MDNYFNVLNAFIDKKDSYYSIHQIGKSLSAKQRGRYSVWISHECRTSLHIHFTSLDKKTKQQADQVAHDTMLLGFWHGIKLPVFIMHYDGFSFLTPLMPSGSPNALGHIQCCFPYSS